MYLYRALYRLPEPVRRIPEKVIDAVYTSKQHTFLAMKVMQPARRLYRDRLRPFFGNLRRRRAAKNCAELGAAPVLEGHNI
jgi:hypothetical protein